MQGLTLEVREIRGIPGTALVTAEGTIDFQNGLRFRERFELAKKEGIGRFILDLDGVTYINSSGLSTLINVAGPGRPGAPSLVLLRVRARIKVLIDLLKLEGLFIFCNTLEEAVDIMGKTGSERAPSDIQRMTPGAMPAVSGDSSRAGPG
jgi:anti-anti-sigma factor